MLPVSDFKTIRIEENKQNFNFVGKIKVKVLVAFTFILFALLFTQLVFANNLATDGEKIVGVESEIQRLEAENTTLKARIAQVSSLKTLSKKAEELGFAQPSELITP